MDRRLLVLALTIAFLTGGTTAFAGTVDLPEIGNNTDKITFDDGAFAVDYDTSGTVLTPGGAVGSDITTIARIGGSGNAAASASLDLMFGGSLVNENGIDLWVYKIGHIESFLLTIDGTTNEYTPLNTHEKQGPGTTNWDISLAKIDLEDFGFSQLGDTGIDTITISSAWVGDLRGNGYYTTPDVAAVAGIIAVPLPSAAFGGLGLLASALAVRVLRRRRRGSPIPG